MPSVVGSAVAKRLPLRAQVELADCGPASLAIVLEYFGRHVPLDELHEACGVGRDGVNALTLVQVAEHYGLRARGVKTELDDLRYLPTGTVMFWSMSHFVVLEAASRRGVTIVDPALGRRTVRWNDADREYSGTAILLEPGDTFTSARRGAAQGLAGYLRPLARQRAVLAQVVGTSLVLRAVGLALPLLTAVIIDRILPVNGRGLLLPIGATVGTMVVASFVATWLRARLLLEARVQVDMHTTLSFLEHLVSLPLTFHQRREAGDLVMRLRSTSIIRETLTTGVLSAMLDGGFAVLYLVLLALTSSALTIAALVLAILQVSAVVATQRTVQRLASESLRVEARSQSYAFQLLAGMSTLKASGTENRAVEEFSNRFVDELRAVARRGRLSALLDSVLGVLAQAGPLVLLGIAALQVLDGRLSLGSALAATALASGFLAPLTTLVGTASSFVLVRSYVERLDDVFDTEPEQSGQDVSPAPPLAGEIRTVNLSFRYAETAPLVVRDVDLEGEAGSFVAIVGPSGSGKTTLAHLLLGLYPPASGRVELDGMDLADARREERAPPTRCRHPGAIPLRHHAPGEHRLRPTGRDPRRGAPLRAIWPASRTTSRRCLSATTPCSERAAARSPVGNGSALPSPARLCSRPRILLLDEATSHLDALTEAKVHASLAEMGCTRIVVAHRLSTVAGADQIIVLDGGEVVERGTHRKLVQRRRSLCSARRRNSWPLDRSRPDDWMTR